jgi:hypothetical protein
VDRKNNYETSLGGAYCMKGKYIREVLEEIDITAFKKAIPKTNYGCRFD